jgi:hypothetical protein
MNPRLRALSPIGAALLLSLGALTACDQSARTADGTPADNSASTDHRVAVNTDKVERGAEHATAQVTAGVTALAVGVERGVKDGTREGRRTAGEGDATVTERTRDDGQTTTTTTTERHDRTN